MKSCLSFPATLVALATSCILLVWTAHAVADARRDRVVVVVNGFDSSDGAALCRLFVRREEFPSGDALVRRADIRRGRATCVFDDPPRGTIAIAVAHDENDNGRLDFGVFGPKEPYGFARGVRGGPLGPPDFEEASVRYAGGVLEVRVEVD